MPYVKVSEPQRGRAKSVAKESTDAENLLWRDL